MSASRWRIRGESHALVVAALAAFLLHCPPAPAHPVEAIDDSGALVRLEQPARRIVGLSPGITELLFEAGAGERVVGVSDFSDYPPQALALPRVSRAQGIDLERVAALRPDLIVAWGSGYSPALLAALRRLGVPVYVHEPRKLESIATGLERLGTLAGAPEAREAAAAFRARLDDLRAREVPGRTVRVFYQVWGDPVMTLSGAHIISEVLRVCGARNIFEDLGPLVATVDVEAVVAARPELIASSEAGGIDHGALERWRSYARIPAVANGFLVTLDGDKMDRASLRILDAAQALCEAVDRVRARVPAGSP